MPRPQEGGRRGRRGAGCQATGKEARDCARIVVFLVFVIVVVAVTTDAAAVAADRRLIVGRGKVGIDEAELDQSINARTNGQ